MTLSEDPEKDTWKHREEGHVRTGAETRVMLLDAKKGEAHQKLEGAREGSPLGPREGMWPLASRTVAGYVSAV